MLPPPPIPSPAVGLSKAPIAVASAMLRTRAADMARDTAARTLPSGVRGPPPAAPPVVLAGDANSLSVGVEAPPPSNTAELFCLCRATRNRRGFGVRRRRVLRAGLTGCKAGADGDMCSCACACSRGNRPRRWTTLSNGLLLPSWPTCDSTPAAAAGAAGSTGAVAQAEPCRRAANAACRCCAKRTMLSAEPRGAASGCSGAVGTMPRAG